MPDNVELEVAATYASGGHFNIDTVPDSRGVTINIHYSISLLPADRLSAAAGRRPRGLLPDRGQGFFQEVGRGPVRALHQSLGLAEGRPVGRACRRPRSRSCSGSRRRCRYKYRKPIRDGILEWNKAFEKAGFVNAIEVRQQPDNADWDPEDINYNTFRWITAGAGFAMGPSRVNPTTGQILDADIIFDADFIQFWKRDYENFTPASIAAMTGGPLDLKEYDERDRPAFPPHLRHRLHVPLRAASRHGPRVGLRLDGPVGPRPGGRNRSRSRKSCVMQGLKEVTMHEVGHTLGLRHNFKARARCTLADVNNPEKTKEIGLTASVMDYSPANIVRQGVQASAITTPTTIGPYDMWAIEYGYKPLSGGTDGEVAELKKIASRSAEPVLAYATDEDTRGIDPDPLANRFDLGSDPIEYAKDRTKLIAELWPGLVDRSDRKTATATSARARPSACCWAITGGPCSLPRAMSAASTSTATTRATPTAGRRSWSCRPQSSARR